MKLLVRNLPRSITQDALQAMFEAHGAVQSCNLVMDARSGVSKGFGFVEMPKVGDAKAAMKNLNGIELEGLKLRVKKAEEVDADAAPATKPTPHATAPETARYADRAPTSRPRPTGRPARGDDPEPRSMWEPAARSVRNSDERPARRTSTRSATDDSPGSAAARLARPYSAKPAYKSQSRSGPAETSERASPYGADKRRSSPQRPSTGSARPSTSRRDEGGTDKPRPSGPYRGKPTSR